MRRIVRDKPLVMFAGTLALTIVSLYDNNAGAAAITGALSGFLACILIYRRDLIAAARKHWD